MNSIIPVKSVYAQTGALLLEIIVSLALSLIVMAVIMDMMLSSIEQSRYQNTVFSVQRQMNRLSQLFYQELSEAGYAGCLRANPDEAIQIRPAEEAPAAWFGKGHSAKARTMVIHIQKMALWHDYLLVDHLANQNQWTLSLHQRLQSGDVVMIANCKEKQLATVLTASAQKDQQIVTTANSANAFGAGSYFGLWQEKTFYIAATDRKTPSGMPIWSLYSYENGQTYEWADGVEDLQFSQISDKQRHTMLIVHILLKSLQRITHRTQSYFFAEQSYRNQDGHLYQSIEIDIPLQPGVL